MWVWPRISAHFYHVVLMNHFNRRTTGHLRCVNWLCLCGLTGNNANNWKDQASKKDKSSLRFTRTYQGKHIAMSTLVKRHVTLLMTNKNRQRIEGFSALPVVRYYTVVSISCAWNIFWKRWELLLVVVKIRTNSQALFGRWIEQF